jgi:hypothetical protein
MDRHQLFKRAQLSIQLTAAATAAGSPAFRPQIRLARRPGDPKSRVAATRCGHGEAVHRRNCEE